MHIDRHYDMLECLGTGGQVHVPVVPQYITFPKTGVVPEWLKTLKSLAYNPEAPL